MIQKDEKEINKNIEEKTFFHLFKVDINELWSYYIQPSFITAYFQEKCKITNIKKINKTLKENDILDLYYQVFDFLTTKNYTNLKILLGNNAEIKPTNNPNEIEIEHFTKNNKAKFIINKNLDFNEKELVIQPIESIIPIPRQIIIIKIINFNKDDCLVMFTHKIKEYIRNDSINNYSLLKKKFLWLLKSTIEK